MHQLPTGHLCLTEASRGGVATTTLSECSVFMYLDPCFGEKKNHD